MKITSYQILRGPNIWSNQFTKLVQLKLDCSLELVQSPNTIISAFEQNKKLLPFLVYETSQTVDVNLSKAIAQAALFLQGYPAGEYYRIQSTLTNGVNNIVFPYQHERIGKTAMYLAEELLQKLIVGEQVEVLLQKCLLEIHTLNQKLDQHLNHLVKVALEHNIPVLLPDEDEALRLGYCIKSITVSKENYTETAIRLEQFFPTAESSRIPIVAITGSNGKTTTTRLIAHILKQTGKQVGYTTSDGIYIGDTMVDEGDTTGPQSARLVLSNTKVEVAVLETARGGILRSGLGFDYCDVGVITNVQDDHLGISDIETMEDLAKVKGVIANAVKPNGYLVLNADNQYTREIGKHSKSNLVWFSMDAQHAFIKNAPQSVYLEDNTIYAQLGAHKTLIANVNNIPITFNGTVKFMTENALAAVAACVVLGVKTEQIQLGLSTFFPSAEQTPGRMNIFDFNHCKVMVDFAHNPEGFTGIKDFLQTVVSPYKIGIIVGTGDRKEEDVHSLGKISAAMFDHILIHQVKFLRGKTAQELIDNLVAGILEQNPKATWERIPDDQEPLSFALALPKPENSFIVALSDVLNDPITLIPKLQQQEKSQLES